MVCRQRRWRFGCAAALALLAALSGCALPRPPTVPALAEIEAVCHGCVVAHAGPAPLQVALYAKSPDNADYVWQAGNEQRSGRFVSYVFREPGEYMIKLTARTLTPPRKLYEAFVFFRVLPPLDLTHHVLSKENELLAVAALAPKEIPLGSTALLRFVITAKRRLDYAEISGDLSRELYSLDRLYGQVLSLPEKRTYEYAFPVSGFSTGSGYVQVAVRAAAANLGRELIIHIPVEVKPKEGI